MQIMLENENTISSRMYLPKPRFKLHIIWDEQYTIWFIGTLKSLIILSSNKEKTLGKYNHLTVFWERSIARGACTFFPDTQRFNNYFKLAVRRLIEVRVNVFNCAVFKVEKRAVRESTGL